MGKKLLSKWFPVSKRKNTNNSFEQLNEENPEEFQKNNSTRNTGNDTEGMSDQDIKVNGNGTDSSKKALQNDVKNDMGIDEIDTEKHGTNINDCNEESFYSAKLGGKNFDSSEKGGNDSKTKDTKNQSSEEIRENAVTNKNNSNKSVAWGVFMVAAGGLHPPKYEEPLEENKWPTWNEERKVNNSWPNWNSERPLDNEWPKWNKT